MHHPILSVSRRKEVSLYYTLFDELCKYEQKFFNYFRMSKSSFFELLEYIKDDIVGQETYMREPISPTEKLVVTLR